MDPGRIRVILFSFLPPCGVSVPGFGLQRQIDGEEEEAGGGGETPHLWVSLLPGKPCLAYLTPVSDDITRRSCPLTRTDSFQYPAWTQRQATGGVWWWWRVSEIMMTKNYSGRNTGMQFISAVNPRRPAGSPTQSPSADREGYICFCLLWMWFVSLPVFLICGTKKKGKKSFVAGRSGSWAFWV